MRIRVVRLPGSPLSAGGQPYLLLIDRLGDDVPTPDEVEQIRTQAQASVVFTDTGDIEFEDIDLGGSGLAFALSDATDDLGDDPDGMEIS